LNTGRSPRARGLRPLRDLRRAALRLAHQPVLATASALVWPAVE